MFAKYTHNLRRFYYFYHMTDAENDQNRGFQSMKKKLGMIILSIGVLIFAYFYAHIDKNMYLYDRNTDSADLIGIGIPAVGEEITQSFTCAEDSIDGINVKATVIGDVEHVSVEYSLLDKENGDVVRTETVPGTEIKNNKFNVLKFQTLKDTKGKNFILRLSESGTTENDGISFYRCQGENQQEMETLVVRILTHRFDLETFVVFLGILAFIAGFMNVLYRMFR